jgi:hypothetical protein
MGRGRFVRAVGEGPRRRRTNRRVPSLDPYKRKSHKYIENDHQECYIQLKFIKYPAKKVIWLHQINFFDRSSNNFGRICFDR